MATTHTQISGTAALGGKSTAANGLDVVSAIQSGIRNGLKIVQKNLEQVEHEASVTLRRLVARGKEAQQRYADLAAKYGWDKVVAERLQQLDDLRKKGEALLKQAEAEIQKQTDRLVDYAKTTEMYHYINSEEVKEWLDRVETLARGVAQRAANLTNVASNKDIERLESRIASIEVKIKAMAKKAA